MAKHMLMIIVVSAMCTGAGEFRMTQLDLSSLQPAIGSGDAAEPALLALPNAAPRQVRSRAFGTPGADSGANCTSGNILDNLRRRRGARDLDSRSFCWRSDRGQRPGRGYAISLSRLPVVRYDHNRYRAGNGAKAIRRR